MLHRRITVALYMQILHWLYPTVEFTASPRHARVFPHVATMDYPTRKQAETPCILAEGRHWFLLLTGRGEMGGVVHHCSLFLLKQQGMSRVLSAS